MVAALPVALALLAQAAPSAPAASPAPPPPSATTSSAPAAARAADACPSPSANSREIVICTQRPQGYRLNPDVLEAKREMKSGGRPKRVATETPPPDCATVGPTPCVTAGINLLGAALTAAEMAKRLAAGQEVGSMFVTDPQPTEYQLYVEAKKRREAREEEKAALAKAKAAQAAAAPPPPPAPVEASQPAH
jgi:hypothetical protein